MCVYVCVCVNEVNVDDSFVINIHCESNLNMVSISLLYIYHIVKASKININNIKNKGKKENIYTFLFYA